jgi:subfamily B ATP-binding cassette protein MsbA
MIDKKLLHRLYLFLKPYRLTLAAAMFCMVIVAGLSAGQAYMVKPLLDKIFFEKNTLFLNLLPLALVILFLMKGAFYYGYTFLLEKVGQGVVKDMRNKIYSHIHTLPISFFHKTPTGELISRVISDVTLVQSAVSHAVVSSIKDIVQIFALLGVVFYQNWKLASMSMLFLPVAVIPIILFGRIHRRLSTKSQERTANVSNILQETITGNRIVKAFCMEDYEVKRFSGIVQKLYGVFIKDTKVRSLSHALMELLGGVFIAFVIWYGGNEVLNGVSTPGTFFSFLTALVMIYEPIKGVSRINSTVQQGVAASTRVFSILDEKVTIDDSPDAKPLLPLKDSVEFKNVSFSYDGRVPVIKNLDLKIKAGEVLAIVGSSGGGKTTLVNLIPRFCDVTEGSITIDGKDIRDATLKSLRGQIAIVTQQTILFNDTIRNNIAYGDLERSEEEIMDAARAAHALEFIQHLPDGFDSVIGESGAKLSGGQRQRLSIARALLKNAPILILDEATSALDTESEREVQKALENLMRDRTTFVIAHRLSTIRNADRIIVVQDGKIVEEGDHETLLQKKGAYEKLHNMQN